MNPIAHTLSSLVLGPESRFDNLTVVPLLGASAPASRYDTLDVALAGDTLVITEVTESGHVPEIRLLNRGDRPVFIMEGEELVGAKQNRTINLSILVPAQADAIASVTCVEVGRWRTRSAKFASSPRTHFAEGRAAKSRQVSQSLVAHGVARADQAQVWDAIALKSERLRTSSDTGAMADIFASHASGVEDYVAAVRPSDDQVGAVLLIDDKGVGLDVFDTAHTLKALLPKIVRGYALDAIDRRVTRSGGDGRGIAPTVAGAHDGKSGLKQRVHAFVEAVVSAPPRSFPTVGLGESWRALAPDVCASALILDGRPVHISAFRG
jgi:hypothetical protein